MEICLQDEIRPNKKFMDILEEFKKECRKLSHDTVSYHYRSHIFLLLLLINFILITFLEL